MASIITILKTEMWIYPVGAFVILVIFGIIFT